MSLASAFLWPAVLLWIFGRKLQALRCREAASLSAPAAADALHQKLDPLAIRFGASQREWGNTLACG